MLILTKAINNKRVKHAFKNETFLDKFKMFDKNRQN